MITARRSSRWISAVVACGAVALAVVTLPAVPALAELETWQQMEQTPTGNTVLRSRAWKDGPGRPPVSVRELNLVNARETLSPRRTSRRPSRCPPDEIREQLPPTGGPRACSRTRLHRAGDDSTGDDLAAEARRAAAELLTQPGTIGILPDRTVTGLKTYYRLDGVGPRQTRRARDGITLTIRATPVAYEWDFGDGTVIHGGPGTNGPPGTSPIHHVYRRRGMHRVTCTVTWTVTFGVNGATTELPDAFTTTAATDLPVDELRAVLTR